MSLALTGAPGWLASALLDDLEQRPLSPFPQVVALSHPDRPARHPALAGAQPFDLACLSRHPELNGIDTVLHAAGVIHVRVPSEWERINTRGTLHLAAAAKAAGARRFVFISSNAAGGPSDNAAPRDEQTPDQPRSGYGWSKWRAEQGLRELERPGVFDVVILRPCMFYGPPVPARHIEVYRRIQAGYWPIMGDGQHSRSLTHIQHLVQAVRLALVHPQAAGQTYYVADEPVYTTYSICQAMAAALDTPLREVRLPAWLGRAAHRADQVLGRAGLYWAPLHLAGEAHWHVGVSSAKIQEHLGYRPEHNLQGGMHEAVQWCRQQGLL